MFSQKAVAAHRHGLQADAHRLMRQRRHRRIRRHNGACRHHLRLSVQLQQGFKQVGAQVVGDQHAAAVVGVQRVGVDAHDQLAEGAIQPLRHALAQQVGQHRPAETPGGVEKHCVSRQDELICIGAAPLRPIGSGGGRGAPVADGAEAVVAHDAQLQLLRLGSDRRRRGDKARGALECVAAADGGGVLRDLLEAGGRVVRQIFHAVRAEQQEGRRHVLARAEVVQQAHEQQLRRLRVVDRHRLHYDEVRVVGQARLQAHAAGEAAEVDAGAACEG